MKLSSLMWIANSQQSWRLAKGFSFAVVIIALVAMIPPGTMPYPPLGEYSDASLSHWPAAAFLRSSILEEHALPLWNPLRALGQPFAANPLNKVWYPPQWLALLLPPTLHLNVLIYLHGAWLILGMLAWARSIDLHPLAGITASLSWALMPKLMGHLGAGHLDLWYAAAWVPWLLWSVSQRQTPRGTILIGATAAMLALADLRMAFYMIPTAVVYAMLQRNIAFHWLFSLLILLGLTAVQIVPLGSLSSSITRSLITAEQAAEFSLPPQMLIGALIPDFGGSHEYMTYLGVPTLALAMLSLRHKSSRVVAGSWALCVLSLLWALGQYGPFFLSITKVLPFASWFRVPSRAWFVVSLAVTMLAAFGVDGLVRWSASKRLRMIGVAVGFGGLLWTFFSLVTIPPSFELRFAILLVGVFLTLTGISIWSAVGLPTMPTSDARLVGTALLVMGGTVSSLLMASSIVKSRAVLSGLSTSDGSFEVFSTCDVIYSPSFALLDPVAAMLKIRTLHTADPFQFRWSAEAIADAANVPYAGYSITAPPISSNAPDQSNPVPDKAALSTLGVTAIVSTARSPVSMTDELPLGDDLYYFALPSANRPIQLCEPGPNRYETEIDESMTDGTTIPLAMAWSPHWRAWIDGQPVSTTRNSDMLLGVEAPHDSEGTLVIVYQPLADYLGIMITAITLVLVAAVWWRLDA